jgi:hypothetical protein
VSLHRPHIVKRQVEGKHSCDAAKKRMGTDSNGLAHIAITQKLAPPLGTTSTKLCASFQVEGATTTAVVTDQILLICCKERGSLGCESDSLPGGGVELESPLSRADIRTPEEGEEEGKKRNGGKRRDKTSIHCVRMCYGRLEVVGKCCSSHSIGRGTGGEEIGRKRGAEGRKRRSALSTLAESRRGR